MDQVKVDRFTVDGRRAEVHVQEQAANGVTERVTTSFEEKIPLEMKKRVSEKVVPVIVERVTEDFDGTEVKKVVERVSEDNVTLRLSNLKSVQPCLSKEDIEEIVNRALSHKVSLPSLPKLGLNPQPLPPGLVYYAAIALLAISSAVVIWQLFIR